MMVLESPPMHIHKPASRPQGIVSQLVASPADVESNKHLERFINQQWTEKGLPVDLEVSFIDVRRDNRVIGAQFAFGTPGGEHVDTYAVLLSGTLAHRGSHKTHLVYGGAGWTLGAQLFMDLPGYLPDDQHALLIEHGVRKFSAQINGTEPDVELPEHIYSREYGLNGGINLAEQACLLDLGRDKLMHEHTVTLATEKPADVCERLRLRINRLKKSTAAMRHILEGEDVQYTQPSKESGWRLGEDIIRGYTDMGIYAEGKRAQEAFDGEFEMLW